MSLRFTNNNRPFQFVQKIFDSCRLKYLAISFQISNFDSSQLLTWLQIRNEAILCKRHNGACNSNNG